MSGSKKLPPGGVLLTKTDPVTNVTSGPAPSAKAEAAFDLSSTFDPYLKRQEEGVELELRHPDTGEALGVFIRIAGPDSKRAIKAARDAVSARVKARRMEMTGDEAYAEQINQLAARVMSWRTKDIGNVIVHNGRKLECTPENVAAVLKRYPPILAQVSNAAAGEVGAPGFTKKPEPPSEEPFEES